MLCLLVLAFTGTCLGAALAPDPVQLDNATVYGLTNNSVTSFLGIPYASPPVRFRPPQILGPYEGSINATAYGPSCPQQKSLLSSSDDVAAVQKSSPALNAAATAVQDEDCLTINVYRPSFVGADYELPVIAWIYGGAFEFGDTEQYDAQSVRIVQRSVALGYPVILVSMNYRVSAFGFLPGKEVYDAGVGNLGLLDQRLALQWINKYIGAFGGNSSKVMLWGESAGSISVAMQLIAYGGNSTDLFHAAFMQSGAVVPVGSLDKGQVYYDFLVNETGCTNSNDTLDCLREVPYKVLKDAVDKTPNVFSYQSLVLAYLPRRDDSFLLDDPQKLAQDGRFANVPTVSGNCDDEGTVFSFFQLNITTDAQFRDYVSQIWLPQVPAAELAPLWSYYPSDPRQGSPFDTGLLNAITPQFKRNAAFQGDAVFQAPRRLFLQNLSKKQKAWFYLSKRAKNSLFVGSYHGSDLVTEEHFIDDYVINFAVNHNPNTGNGIPWPEYTIESPQAYTFPPTRNDPPVVALDDYRKDAFAYLTNISLKYPI
ncbi:carotenoid ester lipase precursor [Gymnopilus junonius]|uniref:Carboxylic ester hydrolase n=1 Tax=Gymnopilus junonius TaxID=109634 RepID=A0A9P5NMG6_GYMJU|nr:carotenoid ester lipase precursor [Gymnopilus junonius]